MSSFIELCWSWNVYYFVRIVMLCLGQLGRGKIGDYFWCSYMSCEIFVVTGANHFEVVNMCLLSSNEQCRTV